MQEEKTQWILLTHNDLDGVSCEIVLSHYVSHFYHFRTSYSDLEECFKQISAYKEPFILVIADVNIRAESNPHQQLRNLLKRKDCKGLIYADHHMTETELLEELSAIENKYIVRVDQRKCAAQVLYDVITKIDSTRKNSELLQFLRRVTAYDTWQQQSYYWKEGLMLNRLFASQGADQFKQRPRLFPLSDWEKEKVLKIEAEEINQVKQMIQQGQKHRNVFYLSGEITAPIGAIADAVGRDFPEIDLVCHLYHNVISLRSRKRNGQGLALKVAKAFGGGGHPDAAGATIRDHLMDYPEASRLDALMERIGGILNGFI